MLQIALEPTRGVEPPTHGLQNRCSTIELRRQATTHRQEYSSFPSHMQPLRLAAVCVIGKVPEWSIGTGPYGDCRGANRHVRVATVVGSNPTLRPPHRLNRPSERGRPGGAGELARRRGPRPDGA